MLRFVRSFLGGQVPESYDQTSINRPYVVLIYSLLGFLSAAGIGLLQIFVEDNATIGYLELTISLIFVLNVVGMKLTGNFKLAARFFLLTLVVLFVVMLVTGGSQGTGIFWVPFFPLAAFFLMQRAEGFYWVVLLFGIIVALILLDNANAVRMFYDPLAVQQLLASLAVVTIGVYVYEGVQENSSRMARQVDKAKSEFLTIASHQLRTPISGIKWTTEILLSSEESSLTGPQREQVISIQESSDRLARLVDAMLIVSSLEVGNMPLRLEQVNLEAAAGSVLEEELQNSGKQLNFKQRYDEGLQPILFDSHVLKLILQNLSANAIKYTPEGGNISLEVTNTPEKLFAESKGSIAIILSDNGYGIPDADKSKIFTKFFRAANIRQKDTDGTGLGLYIVKQLVTYTGGRISFDSHEGQGTTFIVTLPVDGPNRKRYGAGHVMV